MVKYLSLYRRLKQDIQTGTYRVGDLLPSEHELCAAHGITRTTVRKALSELSHEGYIERLQGKGSQVVERRQSLGLLNVKGFSEAVGQRVRTVMLQPPAVREWSEAIGFPISAAERAVPCLHFARLRFVDDAPVMYENNWFAGTTLADLPNTDFVDGSFFRTLSSRYLIEITGSQQELRAEAADRHVAGQLRIQVNDPVLHISIKFDTSRTELHLYSELYCTTTRFPIGNRYQL